MLNQFFCIMYELLNQLFLFFFVGTFHFLCCKSLCFLNPLLLTGVGRSWELKGYLKNQGFWFIRIEHALGRIICIAYKHNHCTSPSCLGMRNCVVRRVGRCQKDKLRDGRNIKTDAQQKDWFRPSRNGLRHVEGVHVLVQPLQGQKAEFW